MIVILGESSSGKSTLQKMLIQSNSKYSKTVSYTTRPMRKDEVHGIDYNFVSQQVFDELVEKDFFIEHATYNGWDYGTAKEDCLLKNSIAVLTPAGLRALKRVGIETTSIYLYVDRRSRLIRALARGDDIEEAYRRNLSDVGQFDGVVDEVDFVIDNTGYHMNETQVFKCMEEILLTQD